MNRLTFVSTGLFFHRQSTNIGAKKKTTTAVQCTCSRTQRTDTWSRKRYMNTGGFAYLLGFKSEGENRSQFKLYLKNKQILTDVYLQNWFECLWKDLHWGPSFKRPCCSCSPVGLRSNRLIDSPCQRVHSAVEKTDHFPREAGPRNAKAQKISRQIRALHLRLLIIYYSSVTFNGYNVRSAKETTD